MSFRTDLGGKLSGPSFYTNDSISCDCEELARSMNRNRRDTNPDGSAARASYAATRDMWRSAEDREANKRFDGESPRAALHRMNSTGALWKSAAQKQLDALPDEDKFSRIIERCGSLDPEKKRALAEALEAIMSVDEDGTPVFARKDFLPALAGIAARAVGAGLSVAANAETANISSSRDDHIDASEAPGRTALSQWARDAWRDGAHFGNEPSAAR